MKKLGVKLKINYDRNKPNGTPRKILNVKLAQNYKWKSNISLNEGFKLTYQDFLDKY